MKEPMRVTVEYFAQLRGSTGVPSRTVDIDGECTAQELITRLAEEYGQAFRSLVLNGNGALQPSILLFVGERQVRWHEARALADGDALFLASPVAGG